MAVANDLTGNIIGAAIEVHRALGPGLLESAYQACLAHELSSRGVAFERERPLPVAYKGLQLDCGYRPDFIVDEAVIVELKAVEKVLPIHEAQTFLFSRTASLAGYCDRSHHRDTEEMKDRDSLRFLSVSLPLAAGKCTLW